MKIAILGHAGSGKSTLARQLGDKYGLPVLHFDAVQFRPGWEIRPQASKEIMVKTFLDLHKDWVIDGNYSKLSFERRMAEADVIIQLRFNRLSSLYRVICRYLTYKEGTRPDMADGCSEKLDWEFVTWVLWKGRSKTARQRYESVRSQYPRKTIVIKNQRQLNAVQDYINKVISQ